MLKRAWFTCSLPFIHSRTPPTTEPLAVHANNQVLRSSKALLMVLSHAHTSCKAKAFIVGMHVWKATRGIINLTFLPIWHLNIEL